MSFWGFVIAFMLFCHFKRRARWYWDPRDESCEPPTRVASWHEEWHKQWAEKFRVQSERHRRQFERDMERKAHREERRRRRDEERFVRRHGVPPPGSASPGEASRPDAPPREDDILSRARRRAAAEVGFYAHLISYLGVIAFLALVNLFTTRYPWFIWPALGWGVGLFSHYMAVFGSRALKERYFEPAVEREVRREKAAMQTEKQASLDEISSTIAHEIRNPIAAAKSLVQQMGEDPRSVENVDYAKVALEELDRVERSISHLLKYAKEEDYTFAHANLAGVVDSALTEMRGKLEAAHVAVIRNYIAGPTVRADRDKLRQVFVNVVDNAIDSMADVVEGRRIDLFIENGDRRATVRVRDNGCGIPADKIGRIFNPFFSTKEKGTGLGMAISKKIVEAHEGTIDVTSEAGRGSEFVVRLPLPE